MPIGAVSLRHNHECCKPQINKSQSFGHKSHDHEQKNHKAAYIAASVGAVAALAVTAYLFRGKLAKLPFVKRTVELGSDALAKSKKIGTEAIDKAGDLAVKAKKGVKETYNTVVEKGGEAAQKTKNAVVDTYNTAVEKGTELVGKAKDFVVKKKPEFSKEDLALFKKFKKTGGNQQGVFDTLKKYGMNESEEKYIKETFTLLNEKFKAKNAKPSSLRVFMNEALKKASAEEIVTEMLENSKNLRKLWKL